MEALVSAEGDTCAVIMFDIESTGRNRQLARMWQLAARCGSSTFERFVAPDNWQWEPVAQDMFRRSAVDLSHAPPLAVVLAEFNDWVRTCFGKMKLFVAFAIDVKLLQASLCNNTHVKLPNLLPKSAASLPQQWQKVRKSERDFWLELAERCTKQVQPPSTPIEVVAKHALCLCRVVKWYS